MKIRTGRMRKSIITTIFLLSSVSGFTQFTGSGTFGSPYSGGTLTTSLTWAASGSPVYVSGDLTIGTVSDAGHLTIEPGVTVIFLNAGADIFITGLGRLSASGSGSQKIRFTADHDNDGNYGESGETWGHISFQSMGAAGASVLSHCIFEYGLSTGTGVAGYGGALHIAFSNVTVSDCIFRHNRAEWGGALFVNQNVSPAIRNCYVYNNRSNRGGGGFYFWNGSSSVVENCVFDSNQVLEPSVSYYTGGGVACQSNTSVKIVNCTFVNNTSTRTEGQALLLHSSPNARVVNSVFWGSDKQVYGYGTGAAVMINSAWQGTNTFTLAGSPVNPLVLNSSNSAADGPNFVATDGSDWSIRFISPLFDTGVNSSPGVTIPTTDHNGNPLVYLRDRGAYEYQYSRWKNDAGTNDWNTAANWHGGVPGAGMDIVIPAGATNYPVGGTPADITLASGKNFIMEPGSRATIGSLTNSGTLKLQAGSSAFSSLILSGYTRASGGTEEIQLYLTGGGTEDNDDYKWHYISSPVPSLSTAVFTGTTPDLAQFVENRPILSLLQGWVAYDGYVYSTGNTNGPTFNTMSTTSNGKGYNYFDYSDHLYTFSGLLNTSSVTAPLAFSGNATLHGYNLLGNPFTSGLDWNYIINDLSFPLNTSMGVYFTRDNVQCTYINGVGVPGDVNGIIPPMQGFFTKTYSTGNSIVLSAAARTHDNIHARYKGSNHSIPLLRIGLTGKDMTDETVIRFDADAKTDWDNRFDAAKLFYADTRTHLYTVSGDTKYTINGQPYPDSYIEIPLVVNVVSEGRHTLSVMALDGLDNFKVKLIDKSLKVMRDLHQTDEYSFTAGPGKIENRFVILISDIAYGVEESENGADRFNVYASDGLINILPGHESWGNNQGTITITDLSGRRISLSSGHFFTMGSVIQIAAPKQTGIYFVELTENMKRYTARVVVR